MKNRTAFKAYLSAYHNEVTGSRLLLVVEFPDDTVYRILVDCGYFQEINYRHLNYVDDLSPKLIDAIVITHNHIDHTGLLPKMVRNGYKNPIYMTKITQELCPMFLYDCCEQQEDNAKDMRDRYPSEANTFKPLYFAEDVDKTEDLIVGLNYRKTLEILPGVKLTFFENGHILGASMVLLQCSCEERKSMNFFFTGDYRMRNSFFDVPPLPNWLKKMELIMVHESTYGNVDGIEIKKCFRENLLQAFEERKHILIGAFAQGRMQELLYYFKCMEEEGLIPSEYKICIDGPLGIKTTNRYKSILSWYNPSKADFMPEDVMVLNPKIRNSILSDNVPKIILTTSGMLSNGPARTYVPMFLSRSDAMIHLAGYAAEETLARALLDAKEKEEMKFGSSVIKKKATVKSTRELTSHSTADEMIRFINQFDNIQLLVINHGSNSAREAFAQRVIDETMVSEVGLIDRDNMYVIYQMGNKYTEYNDMLVKRLPAKLNHHFATIDSKRKEVDKKKRRREEKAQKKRMRNMRKRSSKKGKRKR